MILDNLGVSSTELREEMANGGTMAEAFGNIIKRDMGAGNVVLQESIDLTAQIENKHGKNGKNTNTMVFLGVGITRMHWLEGGKEKYKGIFRELKQLKVVSKYQMGKCI